MVVADLLLSLYTEANVFLTWRFALFYGTILFLTWQIYKLVFVPLTSPLLKKLPHRPFKPLLGNFLEIAREEAVAPYERWMSENKASMIAYHAMFGSVRILVADADIMKHVFVTNSKNYEKPRFMWGILIDIVGEGLLLTEGSRHAAQKKVCNQAFRIPILQNFVPVFSKFGDKLCRLWVNRLKENGGEMDFVGKSMTGGLSSMSLDAIGKCGFDYDFNSLDDDQERTVLAFQRMLGGLGFSWWMLIPFFQKLPTQKKRQWDEDIRTLYTVVSTVVNKKRKILKDKIEDDSAFTDLLTCLLLAKDADTDASPSEKEVRDQVITFMLAGHETTTSALLWCLYNLAHYPEVQDKLRAEVQSVTTYTPDTLEELPYLTAVIKETLRLYPPASLTFRIAQEADRYGDTYIPKGTIVNMNIGSLHRNPAYWDEPTKFIPERFLDESKIKPYTFLPFIAGPNMCIGYRFALMQLKVVLGKLIREMKFQPIAGQTYKRKQRVTMRPDPSLELHVSAVK